jgi:hypothetical protein
VKQFWKPALILVAVGFAYHVERNSNPQPQNRKPAGGLKKSLLLETKINQNKKQELRIEPASLIMEIEKVAACYEKDCGKTTQDPRTDYYNLGQELKQKLNLFVSYVIQNKLQDASIQNLGIKFLAHSDGHVQEAALDLLATQATSPESLEAILQNIIKGIDAELIHQALLELQRYSSLEDQEKIRLTLGEALNHGTPFVALAIADRMNLVLNSQNRAYFKNLMTELDPHSRIYQSLKVSIQEFDRKSQAG